MKTDIMCIQFIFKAVAGAFLISFLVSPTFAQNDDWDITKPLGETREIDFTTDEGTWMSIDTSPDGQWIVFDLLGHIYRLPIEGGEAECLTQGSGLAINLQPSVSPDGKKIAFISDRKGQLNLWTMNSDGSESEPVYTDSYLQASQPVWTPDGKYIIVKREDRDGRYGSKLVMYHHKGGKGIKLIDDQVNGATWPSVSNDGQYLYFQVSLGRGEALNGDFQLRRFEFETGEIVDLTSGDGNGPAASRVSSGGAYGPEVSPDGKWLAFGRQIPDGTISFKGHEYGPRSALWLRELGTGRENKLIDPISISMESGGRDGWSIIPRYSWMPDGKSIVLTEGGKIQRVDVSTGNVETIPFEARVHRIISEQAYHPFRITDEPFQPKYLRWLTKSPDESKLTFQAAGKIWVMQLPDGIPKRITPKSFEVAEFAPIWSPDNNYIVFTSLDESNQGHIWKVDAGGGNPEQLTNKKAFYTHPVWSPDGSIIVATKGGGATARGRTVTHNAFFEIVKIPENGGKITSIATVPTPTDTSPSSYARRGITQASFGLEGRVYFPQPTDNGPDGDRATSLISVKQDGSDKKIHMIFPYADEIVPSPDGNYVAFQEGDNIYLTPFPKMGTGGKPVFIDKKNSQLPIKKLSNTGGLFPKWHASGGLEFGSSNQYYYYDTANEKTDTISINFRVPKDLPDGVIALSGARILTMVNKEVIEDGILVIEDARIRCVGVTNECDTDDADRVINVDGKTIMPGIIDMHSHHYRENRGHRPPNDYEVAMYLAYGVTTNLDNSMWSQNIFPDAERIEAGNLIGPRTYSTGDPLYHGDAARDNKVTNYETAHNEVKKLKSWGAVSIKQYSNPRRDQRQWIIDASRKEDLMVTGHWKLSVVMDGHTGWEHTLPFDPIYADMTAFYGKANAVYTPTWVVVGNGPGNLEKYFAEKNVWQDKKQQIWMPWRMLTFLRRRTLSPETDYNYPLIAQAAADIVAEGGHAAIGGHGEHHGLAPHWEIWMASEAFGNMGALEVATKGGAYFLGAIEDVGTLEKDKLADLLILNSNPLENIRNTEDIEYVMKGGTLYEADHLDEIWPEENEFGLKYWIDEESLIKDNRTID